MWTKCCSMLLKSVCLVALVVSATAAMAAAEKKAAADEEGFIYLFKGDPADFQKNWKVSDHPDAIAVKDGCIVTQGPVAHAFYMGPVEDHNFKDFILKLEVKTTKGANSGVYFHTKWQEKGYPGVGYEAQVNTSHGDPVKTASLYNTVKKFEKDNPTKDDEWFDYTITVKGKNITLEATTKDGKSVKTEYTEPEQLDPKVGQRKLSSGTFALQGHDPAGIFVYYRNIRVKPLK
jgi:hypothetical protein